eukprot:scaffold147365_cov36-Tisochrysis_lutea.AAC.2
MAKHGHYDVSMSEARRRGRSQGEAWTNRTESDGTSHDDDSSLGGVSDGVGDSGDLAEGEG